MSPSKRDPLDDHDESTCTYCIEDREKAKMAHLHSSYSKQNNLLISTQDSKMFENAKEEDFPDPPVDMKFDEAGLKGDVTLASSLT
jgi:hypothetical protein